MPKTIDNDVVPIWLSLGAWTAAEQVLHQPQTLNAMPQTSAPDPGPRMDAKPETLSSRNLASMSRRLAKP